MYLKRGVDAVQTAKLYTKQTRQNLHGHTAEALMSLRQAAGVSVLPGAKIVIDRAFSSANDISNAEEANVIVSQAYQEIMEIVQRDEKGTSSSASKILGVLRRCGK